MEIKIAEDGEILVRGDNVTTGYFNAAEETARAFEDGWFHTGDIGELAPDGQVFIRGRKKEMIVTPEGLNVFPEDVERVLNDLPGVRDSAVVGLAAGGSEERVHAVLVVDPGVDPDAVVRAANAVLADHQKIRRALIWPEPELPRTEGTRKLKRAAIRDWARSGGLPIGTNAGGDVLAALVAKYAGRDQVAATATIEELGLSSLERVELMVALEDKFQTRIDEGAFTEAKSVAELRSLVEKGASGEAARVEPVDFPSWNRAWPARAHSPRQPADVDPAAGPGVRLDARRRAREPCAHRWPGDLRRQPSEPHGRAGDYSPACRRGCDTGSRRRWPRNFSSRISFRSSTDAPPGSPTASTTTCRRCSSTRFRCRSARPARGRPCAISARCSKTDSPC